MMRAPAPLRRQRGPDPYQPEHYPDPAVCGQCGVVYVNGGFKWQQPPPEGADGVTCPACLTIRDASGRGRVLLRGERLAANQERLLSLIEACAESEKQSYPLDRIITVMTSDEQIEITTTFEHLARRLAETLHRNFRGEMSLTYRKNDQRQYICWIRD